MAYKALYRTYRPQTFGEVIGQEVIVKTLQNALKNNRISHAYLFCGPRGTGKTTIARLFAKALNCENFNGEPCNQCKSCQEITDGINPDVIEIDAASNNSVDEIRDLKDKIKFLPAGSKYKIYIIDEVHMLTTSAFNALLKTLEEPPKHAIFILATTEPQKVLPTIISRCQRFDFAALSDKELVEALENICVNENVDYDKNALLAIAKASDGGLRDAISFLDQAISLCDDKITEEVSASVTGLVSNNKLFELANKIEEKNISDSIVLIQELQNSGKEVGKIVNSLLSFYRDILIVKSFPGNFDEKYIEFGNKIDLRKVYFNIDVLSDVQSKIRFGNTPDIYLEVAVIKMINASTDELDYGKRIHELEEKVANGDFGGTPGETNVEDLKRLRVLETKFNNLLTELSKLELPKLIETVKNLSSKEISTEENKVDESELKAINSKLDQFYEDIELLKAMQQGFRNELNNTKSGEVDEFLLNEKINAALKNNSKSSVNSNEVKEIINSELENIKEKLNDMPVSSGVSNNELKEIKDRLAKVESNVYKVIAGMLSTQQAQTKKKDKVNAKQISFWKDELVDVDKVSNNNANTKVDFGELAQDNIEEDSHEENVQNENVQEEYVQEEYNAPVQEEVKVETKEETIPQEEVNSYEDSEENYDEEELEELGYEEDNADEEESVDENAEDEDEEETLEEEDDEENGNLFGETEFEQPEEEIETKPVEENNSWYNPETVTEDENKDTSIEEENIFNDEVKPVEEVKEVVQEEAYQEENIIEESINTSTPVEEVKEESIEEPIKPLEDDLDEYERFDVKVLERIFNDAFLKEYFGDKERLMALWKHLTTLAPAEKIGIAEVLAEGEIKAVGNHEFVLVYDSALVCNQVISRKFKKQALKLLHDLLDGDFNYFAITREIFTLKRQEYAQQYYIGVKFPSLTPINDPNLKCDIDESDDDSMSKKAKDLFGDDLTIN